MAKKYIFLLFFVLLGAGNGAAQAQADKLSAYNIIKDFTSEWLVYDSQQESYVPYVQNTPFDYKSASFQLNTRAYSGGKLVCALQAGSSLLIEEKIVGFYKKEQTVIFDIDSLALAFEGKKLFVTIFNPSFDPEQIQMGVTINTLSFSSDQAGVESIIQIQARKANTLNNFIIGVFLFLLAVVAALRYNYPKLFREFVSIPKAYAINIRNVRDEVTSTQKMPGQAIISFVLLYTLSLSFILVVILPAVEEIQQASQWLKYESLNGLVWLWLKVTAVVLISVILKYFWVSIMASVFGAGEVSTLHFFDYIKMGLVFYIISSSVILIIVGQPGIVNEEYFHFLAYGMMLFSFFRVLMLFLKLNNVRLLSGVQLFSYLCGTEILPLIIGLNILLNG